MAANDYLVKKGNVWHVEVNMPPRLRKKGLKPARFRKALGPNLAEANRTKHAHIAAFKATIARLEAEHDPEVRIKQEALEWRKSLTSPDDGAMVLEGHDQESSHAEQLRDHIEFGYNTVLDRHGLEAANRFK